MDFKDANTYTTYIHATFEIHMYKMFEYENESFQQAK